MECPADRNLRKQGLCNRRDHAQLRRRRRAKPKKTKREMGEGEGNDLPIETLENKACVIGETTNN